MALKFGELQSRQTGVIPIQMFNKTAEKSLNAIVVVKNPSKPGVTTVKLILSLKSFDFECLFFSFVGFSTYRYALMYNQGIGLQIENSKPHCEFLREGYFAKEECKFGREKQNQDDADSCLNKH